MTIQTINVGGYANDGTGDDLRTAFEKVNANFTLLGGGVIIDGTNLGGGAEVFAQKNDLDATLEFKTFVSSDDTIEIDGTDPNVIDLKSKAIVENDTSPSLSADLELNGNNIVLGSVGGGNIETPIFGIDVRNLNSIISLMITSNSVDLDFGSFILNIPGIPDPAAVTVDMNGVNPDFGGFSVADPSGLILDLGSIV